MRKHGIRLPSPALVLAVVALVAAVSGVSYAAVKIGKGTVTTKSLKNKSVTNKKLAPAVRGQAVAWAEVAANGSFTASRGLTSANLTSSANGFYCFDNLPVHGAEAVTPGWTGDEFGSFAIASLSKPASTDLGCAAGTDLAVVTQFFNIATDTAPYSPRAFNIVLHK